MNIYKYNDIDIKKINYDKPTKMGQYYYSSISYQNKPLQVLSPKMKCLNLDGKKNSVLDCESINNDFSFYEDNSSIIQLDWSDIDSDSLNITMTQGDNISFAQNENEFEFTASLNWFGSETFVASVSDGGLSDSKAFTITVNSINDSPELLSIGNVEFDEDSSIM